jgi:hypothetical protein
VVLSGVLAAVVRRDSSSFFTATDDLCFAAIDDFPTADDLCFATADEAATTHDAASKEEFEKARISIDWMNTCLQNLNYKTEFCSRNGSYFCAVDPQSDKTACDPLGVGFYFLAELISLFKIHEASRRS